MFGQEAQAPSIEVQRFVQSASSKAKFFLSIFCVKAGEVGVGGELPNCY